MFLIFAPERTKQIHSMPDSIFIIYGMSMEPINPKVNK